MRYIRVAVVVGLSLFFPSCSFFSPREAKLKFTFENLGRAPGLPSAVTGFDCLAINIMGDGIAQLGPSPNRKSMQEIIAGNYCTYPGIVTGLIPSTGSANLEITIPTGPQRVIQILGIKAPGGCNVGADIRNHFDKAPGNAGDPIFNGIYEVGRVVEDVFYSKTINVPNTYDQSAPKEVRCSQGACTWEMEQATPFARGSGTAAAPYGICTPAQFQAIAAEMGQGKAFELIQDIDFENTSMEPIGAPTGTFDGMLEGNGYTIKNINITSSNSSNGLFPSISGTVKNLSLSGTVVSTSPSVAQTGLFAASNSGTIESCAGSGSVTGRAGPTGGFVGTNSGSISSSSSSATVTSTSSATSMGGFVGTHFGGTNTITGCVATGNVTGTNQVGGFAGVVSRPILESRATGTVVGSQTDVGGFAGKIEHNVYKCGAAGQVTGTVDNVGGFAGRIEGAIANVSLSYAKGNVQGNDNVGGFAGLVFDSADVSISYSWGNVVGQNDVGGFIGDWDFTGTLATVYSKTSSITATSNLGALIGNPTPSGSVSDGYSNSAITNSGDGISGTPVTDAQLKLAATFSGWNFTLVWDTKGDTSYPVFRYE